MRFEATPRGWAEYGGRIDISAVRDEWAPYDLETPSRITVEVKSAAFLQSWHQPKPSRISFAAAATRSRDPLSSVLSPETGRQADVHVFALLRHRDKRSLDFLNVAQWTLFVLPAHWFDRPLTTRP